MPEWDDNDRGRKARTAISRRVMVAGALALGLGPAPGLAQSQSAPLRVGLVEGLGWDAADLNARVLGRWGRPAIVVPFRSWGTLRDHASAASSDLIDLAVLPAAPNTVAVPPPGDLRALVVLAVARPTRVGIGLSDPRSDDAVRRLLPAGAPIALVSLPPGALLANLAAGTIDGAVVVGTAVAEGEALARRRGLSARSIDGARAGALIPPLALVRRLPSAEA